MKLEQAAVYWVRMPMRRTVRHARAARSVADNLIVRVVLDGIEGAGESVPREYVTGETPQSAFDAIASLDLAALTGPLAATGFAAAVRQLETARIAERFVKGAPPNLAAACAVELALLDAVGQRFGEPLAHLAEALELPETLRQTPGAVHLLSRGLDLELSLEEFLKRSPVFHHVKVKIGLDDDRDVERLAAVRGALGPRVPVSVDVNMAWTPERAKTMVRRLEPYEIGWYEEPLPKGGLEAYAALRRETGARVMLDESLCTRADAEAAIALGACDLFNLRISKVGGLIAAIRLAELAHDHGLQFQLGAQVGEMGLLWAAGRQFMDAVRGAVALGGARQNFDTHITTPAPFVDPTTFAHGTLGGRGLGVSVDWALVERHAVRRAFWSVSNGEWREAPGPATT